MRELVAQALSPNAIAGNQLEKSKFNSKFLSKIDKNVPVATFDEEI